MKIFQIRRTFTQKLFIIAFKLCQDSSQLFFFFPSRTQILFKILQFLMILSISIFKSNPFFFMSPQSNSQSSNLSDSFLADIIAIWDKLVNSFFELFIFIIKSNYFLSMLTNFSAGFCISFFILVFSVIESMSQTWDLFFSWPDYVVQLLDLTLKKHWFVLELDQTQL